MILPVVSSTSPTTSFTPTDGLRFDDPSNDISTSTIVHIVSGVFILGFTIVSLRFLWKWKLRCSATAPRRGPHTAVNPPFRPTSGLRSPPPAHHRHPPPSMCGTTENIAQDENAPARYGHFANGGKLHQESI